MSSYLEFPAEEVLLERLHEIDDGRPQNAGLFEAIAAQLANRTLDSAAFSLILIEMMHRQEETIGEELATFLPKCVLALTEDEDLARSARAAFRELGPSADR